MVLVIVKVTVTIILLVIIDDYYNCEKQGMSDCNNDSADENADIDGDMSDISFNTNRIIVSLGLNY